MAATTTPTSQIAFHSEGGVMRLYIKGVIATMETLAEVMAQMAEQATAIVPHLVEVIINSVGGSVSEAAAIRGVLNDIPARKVARITGICASAATSIALDCHWIEMTPDSLWVSHEAVGPGGTAAQLAANARTVEELNQGIATELHKRAVRKGKTIEDVRRLMAEDRAVGAQEALEWGFIDAISGMQACAFVAPEPTPTNHPPQSVMNEKELAALAIALGLPANATAEQVLAKQQEVAAKQAENTTELANLRKQLEESTARQIEANATSLVDKAITEGRIPATAKDAYLNMAKANYEATKAAIEALPANGGDTGARLSDIINKTSATDGLVTPEAAQVATFRAMSQQQKGQLFDRDPKLYEALAQASLEADLGRSISKLTEKGVA